jgi:hypothetical protein
MRLSLADPLCEALVSSVNADEFPLLQRIQIAKPIMALNIT